MTTDSSKATAAEIAITGGYVDDAGRHKASFVWPEEILGPLLVGPNVRYVLSRDGNSPAFGAMKNVLETCRRGIRQGHIPDQSIVCGSEDEESQEVMALSEIIDDALRLASGEEQ